MAPAYFFDTWAWVAYFNRSDTGHESVKQLWEELRFDGTPIVTSWPVITETIGFACSKRGTREWSKDGGFELVKTFEEFVTQEFLAAVLAPSEAQLKEALVLRVQHGSIPGISHVDCLTAVLIRAMPPLTEWVLVSGDSHFDVLLSGVRRVP